MHRVIKCKLYPNKEQEKKLNNYIDICRMLYNMGNKLFLEKRRIYIFFHSRRKSDTRGPFYKDQNTITPNNPTEYEFQKQLTELRKEDE